MLPNCSRCSDSVWVMRKSETKHYFAAVNEDTNLEKLNWVSDRSKNTQSVSELTCAKCGGLFLEMQNQFHYEWKGAKLQLTTRKWEEFLGNGEGEKK